MVELDDTMKNFDVVAAEVRRKPVSVEKMMDETVKGVFHQPAANVITGFPYCVFSNIDGVRSTRP